MLRGSQLSAAFKEFVPGTEIADVWQTFSIKERWLVCFVFVSSLSEF